VRRAQLHREQVTIYDDRAGLGRRQPLALHPERQVRFSRAREEERRRVGDAERRAARCVAHQDRALRHRSMIPDFRAGHVVRAGLALSGSIRLKSASVSEQR